MGNSNGPDQTPQHGQNEWLTKTNGLPEMSIDTFRKMQGRTDTVVPSRSHIESGHSVIKPKKKSDDSAQLDRKIRCPCGNSTPNDSMIKCVDPQCNIWQHVGCVIITENPSDSISRELPSRFYCEMCRIIKADPFWSTISYPLLPILIAPTSLAADGSYTVQYTAKQFTLSRAIREMLQKAEYDLQVWCILLNDKVPFRMHWPLDSDMQINGIHLKVVDRSFYEQLGANGRDDGPILTKYLIEGPNKIALSRDDPRTFCLGIRIAKRRSLEQVLNLVPKEQDGEKFDDALARVRRCSGGGTEANNGDSDSDIEVVADSVSVNLRCPMTASRIRIAGRFKPCAHMGCFDLEAFIEINQQSRKWQCPICLKNYSLENIIIDPYFNRITSLIQSCGVDTCEIDIRPDGSWRVKGRAELKDLTQWHLAQWHLARPNMGNVKDRTQWHLSGIGFTLGIRKNNNGGRDTELVPSSDNDHARYVENRNCGTLTSNIEDAVTEDASCNIEQGRHDFTTSHVHDLDYSPVDKIVPQALKEQAIIILSDSDDDDTVLSPSDVNCGSAFKTGNPFPPDAPETSGTCGEQRGGYPNETSFLAINEGSGDLGLSFWECPLSSQDDPNYQMFDPRTRVTDNPGMDRYQRVEKFRNETSINQNEIRITTQGRMWNYISYGMSLLEENGHNEISIKGMGRAINKAVMVIELIKRKFGGLHQSTSIESVDITDTWEPLEEGLLPLETTRHISMITITLSKKALDISSPGYQPPIRAEEVKPAFDYEHEDSYPAGRGRGHAGGRRGRGRAMSNGPPPVYDYNKEWEEEGDYYSGGQRRGRSQGRGRGFYGGGRRGGYASEYAMSNGTPPPAYDYNKEWEEERDYYSGGRGRGRSRGRVGRGRGLYGGGRRGGYGYDYGYGSRGGCYEEHNEYYDGRGRGGRPPFRGQVRGRGRGGYY